MKKQGLNGWGGAVTSWELEGQILVAQSVLPRRPCCRPTFPGGTKWLSTWPAINFDWSIWTKPNDIMWLKNKLQETQKLRRREKGYFNRTKWRSQSCNAWRVADKIALYTGLEARAHCAPLWPACGTSGGPVSTFTGSKLVADKLNPWDSGFQLLLYFLSIESLMRTTMEVWPLVFRDKCKAKEFQRWILGNCLK